MRLRLNSPNDLIVRSDGTVYFTDPPYGINTAQQELSFNGVFRLAPNGTLTTEWRGPRTARPNGIALTLEMLAQRGEPLSKIAATMHSALSGGSMPGTAGIALSTPT